MNDRYKLNKELAQMLKGGVIMDVTTPEQARIAQEAGACAVMALERIPADIRAAGGVSRLSDPKMIKGIQEAVSIPVMAKCRIGHFAEAQILEAIEIDYIDESEVLTPADDRYHIDKRDFTVPFVCGCRNLGEALRRIAEGAAMIRTKGESGTGNVVEAGDYQKPGADAAEPFFVVDADGRAWTNALENLRPADGITNVGAALQSGYVISTATGKAIKTSDTGFRVTQPVDVTSAAQVLVTAWAYTGFALYSFFDAAGTCLAVKAADADYAAGGNTLTRQAVAVPQGAATLIVAGNLYQALPAVRLVSAANLVQQVKSMTVAWHANYVLKISGSTVNYANENRRISEKVAAAAGDTYRLSCSANWNNALYVIYAADNSVLACRQAPNYAAGEVLTDFAVTMPENTAYFRVAANLEIQPESYAVAQYTTRIAAKAPVLTVAAVRTLLDILRAGTYTQSQQSAIQNLENALLIID